jgi:hypothetical protein
LERPDREQRRGSERDEVEDDERQQPRVSEQRTPDVGEVLPVRGLLHALPGRLDHPEDGESRQPADDGLNGGGKLQGNENQPAAREPAESFAELLVEDFAPHELNRGFFRSGGRQRIVDHRNVCPRKEADRYRENDFPDE